MDCQRCGRQDALVHLTEIRDGEVFSIWLCPACAKDRQVIRPPLGESDEALFDQGTAPDPATPGDADPLADFLGEDDFQQRMVDPAGIRTCPACGFQLEDFFRQNRLGCPGCYRAFEPNLRPFLARHHGRAIHLGKVPPASSQGYNPLADMTRARVALEKAVAAEDFEEAARLRDHLKMLQDKQMGQGEPE
jgi:protein arginine kinase activator